MGSAANKSQAKGRSGDDDAKTPTPPKKTATDQGGFFSVYKRERGYWTRIGTAAAAAGLIFGVGRFIFADVFGALQMKTPDFTVLRLSVTGGVCALLALWAWWLMNKPTNAEFLIATDDEMKKVNWSTRAELIGATRVVIFFMFFVAAYLFVVDFVFQLFFILIGVVDPKFSPIGWPGS